MHSEPLFGQEPNEESIAAWNSLLPSKFCPFRIKVSSMDKPSSSWICLLILDTKEGRGWVHMRNKTALPDMPGLNQSLPEHIALPSVYHQLHCLVSPPPLISFDLLSLSPLIVAPLRLS